RTSPVPSGRTRLASVFAPARKAGWTRLSRSRSRSRRTASDRVTRSERESFMRCMCLALSFFLHIAAAGASAHAQSYPARPVTIVVPDAAGGGIDVIARLLAQRFTEKLGQPFVVDNRLGAGGVIASTLVAKAAPDGHTLLLASDAQFAIQVPLRRNLPYDPVK